MLGKPSVTFTIMARADLSVHGPQYVRTRRFAASVTRYEVGEPIHGVDTTLTSGVATTNTWVLAAADSPIIGTHVFGGVAISNCQPFSTGTVTAHTGKAVCPVAWAGLIRGRAETVGSMDSDAELLLILNDAVLIDYNATGAVDGGQLYTIKEAASADTSGLTIVDGNPATSRLDCEIDGRCYRIDVS